MIQQLSTRYQKAIAVVLLTVFYTSSLLTAAYGSGRPYFTTPYSYKANNTWSRPDKKIVNKEVVNFEKGEKHLVKSTTNNKIDLRQINSTSHFKTNIGGPSQPEMSTFKSVGTNNLVNLFTGDFSYNIPLLDVGGYPVNIFYDGGVGMEQEASWVGLGWNINPGNINRNMRGVPDDFDGSEVLTQTQAMKKNRTWGLTGGFNVELLGIKVPPGELDLTGETSLGISFNNYLGPALERSIKGAAALTISGKVKAEKSALGLKAGSSIGITNSSRTGVNITPSVSLMATASNLAHTSTFGLGFKASTSYNSRIGIKAIQIEEQMSFNTISTKGARIIQNFYSDKGIYNMSTNLTFTKPTYIPSIRMPVTNSSYTARFDGGSGIFGVKGVGADFEVFRQVSEIKDQVQHKPLVGFLYLEKAQDNPNAVVDFTRLNDNEVTDKTPIISAPQYAYDVFSIQGEGTGGSFRAYRNDIGYVRDNYTTSRDQSYSLGADIAPPGHYGASFEKVKTPSTIGEWNDGNKLKGALVFKGPQSGGENVYFRNPGESSVLDEHQFDKIGGTDLVRFQLGGTETVPTIEPVLERFSTGGKLTGTVSPLAGSVANNNRKKRSQVISFLTAAEASRIGLDHTIKSYQAGNVITNGALNYESIERCGDCGAVTDPLNYRRSNHISQINITEATGRRYIFGIPVYNIQQKDFTFTTGSSTTADANNDIVSFEDLETTPESAQLLNTAYKDGYVQKTETPAYAHSFLLTGLLSPDYVDVTNDGITEDDLGSAVKFNYTRIKNNNGAWAVSKWRTPLTSDMQANYANFSAGKRTETKDDKGIVSYGERESWYTHSIESKSMIAIFTLENREDSKISFDEFHGVDKTDNTAKRLKKIDLYNKADLKKNGLEGARPIKTVHFEYNYDLCSNYPANSGANENSSGLPTTNANIQHGKLTLQKIYFTYNGQDRAHKSQYIFDYGTPASSVNPAYTFNATDRWGTYKPVAEAGASNRIFPQTMRNADHPYAYQSDYPGINNSTEISKKSAIDDYASAWMLKRILLPTGGQMEVQYESDDYAFVQNKRAAVMMQLDGLGNSADYSQKNNNLYDIKGIKGVNALLEIKENNYAFIKVPEACVDAADVKNKYLAGLTQLAFKLVVDMPKGQEYLNSYANIKIESPTDAGNYGVVPSNHNIIWVKLETVDGMNPLSLTAIEFLREQLPGQAVPYSDVSGESSLLQSVHILLGMLATFGHEFDNPVKSLRGNGSAQSVDLSKCFVRLNDPDGYKYGGGHRVKSVRLKDNWQKMTNQYTSEYGQDYNYETTEVFNGQIRTISSGVASYEPSMGGDENPFQTMYQVGNTVPLGPTSYGSIEMPVLDAFFPSPVVGYSKVTVKSIKKGTATQKSKSGVGKQVTEFYTAKDYPVYYSNTPLDASSDFKAKSSSFSSFFWKYAFDSRAISQGFLVTTNDMHGKMKTQASFMENDDKTPVNRTTNFYSNTGSNEGGDDFDFVFASEGGRVTKGKMGVDIELMTDTREFSVKSKTSDYQAQINDFPVFGLGPWIPFPWLSHGSSENTYRAVTTTKVISYHSVLTSVEVIDKGSQVSTENTLFDAETGNVVMNKTKNEFKQTIFNTSYPAYWAYSGMGPAYKNIDAVYDHLNFSDGKILNLTDQNSIFESGDELYVRVAGTGTPSCISPSQDVMLLWAFDKNKNNSSLTDVAPDLYFMDASGKLFTKSNVSIKIVRSGKRNMLGAGAATVVSMKEPFANGKLAVSNSNNVINASAVEYKEKWQTDNDVFNRYRLEAIPSPNLIINGDFSQGNTAFTTQYNYNSGTNHGAGDYNVGNNLLAWGGGVSNCSDHTSGTGNMMMVDGSQQSQQNNFVVWSQTVAVQPNTSYTLSAWLQTISSDYPTNLAKLKILINGTDAGIVLQGIATACQWNNFSGIWNSGNNTTAAISIVDYAINLNRFGNDYALDDISFSVTSSCGLQEVADCNGYLEKNINPYVKGLLGNFITQQSKVFYHSRTEQDPTLKTRINANGFLSDFASYWNFDELTKNLMPDINNLKWVWNSQITKINSKGLELETKNALDIYTAAQYGFNKTVPTAVANNSRYQQMFNEGFEDDGYEESLNAAKANSCFNKHIDFTKLEVGSNASIVSSDQAGFNAHTGKRMLSVTGQAIKKLTTTSLFNDNYNLVLESDVTKVLNNTGGNANYGPSIGSPQGNAIYKENPLMQFNLINDFYMTVAFQPTLIGQGPGGPMKGYHSPSSFDFYIKIETAQEYDFFLYLNSENRVYSASDTYSNGISASIVNVETGVQVDAVSLFQDKATVSENGTSGPVVSSSHNKRFLCPGIYHVIGSVSSDYTTQGNGQDSYNLYQLDIGGYNSGDYQNLNTVNGCAYTKPIPATIEMQNPTFSMPTGKKMQFSAWVHETCTDAVCPQTSFTKSNIEIWSDGVKLNTASSHITQTGPIIEGWQKVEGDFILPANASTSEIRFVNTNTAPMYVDDIRIHPYNANMKSYVYDPINLRLSAELDENNYAKFYEYDEEGTLVRTKAETKAGIKTITETRSANQKIVTDF